MLVLSNPSPEWAALRLWAAELRDRLPEGALKADVLTLITMLDTQEGLRTRHPLLGDSLWVSCRLLADKITAMSGTGTNPSDDRVTRVDGDWRELPPPRTKK